LACLEARISPKFLPKMVTWHMPILQRLAT
jgi:hypothetical protein